MTKEFISRPILALAIGLTLHFIAVADSVAQTLVYRFEIKREAGINFESFESAYFVVDGLGGEGTFVFTYREDGRDFYLAAANSGTLFFAVTPGEDKAVVRASAQAGGTQSHYLAVGDLDGRVSATFRGQKVTLGVAKTLNGRVMASDPEEDVEIVSPGQAVGVAGFATLKGHLDDRLTRDANRAQADVGKAVERLIGELERSGYENGDGEADSETSEEVVTGEVP
jgi:hypothetical protein